MNKHIPIDIPYVDLGAQYSDHRDEILLAIDSLLLSGNYIGGEIVEDFEEKLKHYVGVPYSLSLNSGTDALFLALKALDIKEGDEVITQPNSFIASAAAIVQTGAKVVFADVMDDQQINPAQIEKAITEKTKAIMPVHLSGRMGDMDAIMDIAKRYDLYVIEDAAQAIGSTYKKRNAGSIGNFGAFSAHPLKNLNACGDAGYLTSSNEKLMQKIKLMANHGLRNRNDSLLWGSVSRLDAIQACILNIRLRNIEFVIEKRRHNAAIYKNNLNNDIVYFCKDRKDCRDTYHTFVIQINNRDALQEHLLNKGIQTAIHYPVPIHLQTVGKKLGYKENDFPNAEKQANRCLTLPVHQNMKEQDIIFISETINQFLNKN